MAEIQVGAFFSMGNLITRAAEALESSGEVRLTGINFSASKVIDVAEMLKHAVKGLHQVNELESFEGKTRLTIVCSTKKLSGSKGYYTAPIPADQVEEKSFEALKTRPPRKNEGESGNREEGEGRRGNRRGGRRGRRGGARGEGEGNTRGRGGEGNTRGGRGGRQGAQKKAAPKKPAAEARPSKFSLVQKQMEEEKRQSNEVFITNADIPEQLESVKALAKSNQNITIKAIGNNIYKAVTIGELVKAESKLSMFSKISSKTHEGSSFSLYEAYLTKGQKPDNSWL